jgi:hypothetical protein
MGSITVVAWIAKLAFLGLFVWGVWSGELRRALAAVFLVLGLAIWLGLPELPNGSSFVTTALAILDIAMVFVVFKRDVRFW